MGEPATDHVRAAPGRSGDQHLPQHRRDLPAVLHHLPGRALWLATRTAEAREFTRTPPVACDCSGFFLRDCLCFQEKGHDEVYQKQLDRAKETYPWIGEYEDRAVTELEIMQAFLYDTEHNQEVDTKHMVSLQLNPGKIRRYLAGMRGNARE